MSKFTPGPWRLLNGKNIVGPKNQIAKVWMFNDGEGTANARLIASAPDMYEALSDLVGRINKFIDRRFVDDGPDWEYSKLHDRIEAARAALAKAEGK